MTATAHALIGAAIVTKIPNPWVGLSLALLSHLPGDLLPHWDEAATNHKEKFTLFYQATLDVLLGFALVGAFFTPSRVHPLYLFAGIIFAQLLDWIQIPYWLLDWQFFPFRQIKKFQSYTNVRIPLPWGLLTQVAAVIVFFALFDLIPFSTLTLVAR